MPSRPAPTPAPTTPPRRTASPVRRVLERALTPFWVVPALWCLGAVAAGVLVPEVDDSVSDWMPFVFRGGADGARAVLSTIAGAMISVTGLVFSITIVVLQLASSQFSPRVLQTFLEDRVTQNTLGVFAASFLYSLTVLRSVEDRVDSSVPQLGVTLAFLLVLAAVAMFLAFIHHITQAISVTTVIRRVGDETRDLLDRRDPRQSPPDHSVDLPHLGSQTVVTAARTGYVDRVDPALLCRLASEHDVRIEVLRPLGAFVTEGAPVAAVRGEHVGDDDWSGRVHEGVGIVRERTMTQDVSFGIRRLVDIAERALSPGTNDPTTATQAIDELHDVLRRLAIADDPSPVWSDVDGIPRVVTTEHTFSDLLDLAVDEIAHWGADGVQTPRRLASMFTELEAATTGPHRQVLVAKAAEVAGATGRPDPIS
ncbi:MAG: DUF2254 domain-containing protein [Nocardioides sp.]